MKDPTIKAVGFIVLFFASVTCIAYGRVATFDLTEGQALIEGWPFWTAGIILSLLACLIIVE